MRTDNVNAAPFWGARASRPLVAASAPRRTLAKEIREAGTASPAPEVRAGLTKHALQIFAPLKREHSLFAWPKLQRIRQAGALNRRFGNRRSLDLA
jgi:hypothetical protein